MTPDPPQPPPCSPPPSAPLELILDVLTLPLSQPPSMHIHVIEDDDDDDDDDDDVDDVDPSVYIPGVAQDLEWEAA